MVKKSYKYIKKFLNHIFLHVGIIFKPIKNGFISNHQWNKSGYKWIHRLEWWDLGHQKNNIPLVACCIKTNEVVPYYMIIPKSYYAYRIITIFTYGENMALKGNN